jgi:molecular chaperone HscB
MPKRAAAVERRLPLNYYDFFEIPHHLSLDLKDLEERFYALSRKWHPDRFARASEADRQDALDASAILNDGYRTLKDPVKRAGYLLKEQGFDIGEQQSKDVPPELLEEVFELNMALEESDAEAIAKARATFEAMQREIDEELGAKYLEYDGKESREVLGEIRGLLNRRRYVENLVQKTENIGPRIHANTRE